MFPSTQHAIDRVAPAVPFMLNVPDDGNAMFSVFYINTEILIFNHRFFDENLLISF
jgi:hypothetical protein